MNLSHLQRHSLKTRVTLLALSIFVINIWLLSFYTTRMLRNDLERHLSEQQFSTVSFMVRDINQELDLRLRALETIAAKVSPLMSGNAAALQQYLEGLPLLTFLFNSGMLVVGPDGTTIADVPRSAGRLGVNYMNRDFVVAALKEGKTTISQPVMGKVLKAPLIGMVVPIRDGRGKVIGALDGVSALGESSFLDKVTNSSYGKTGSYLLVARQSRMIVTAGEKNLIMTPLLGVGVIPLIDRFVDGYEGSGILVNRLGEERLSSTKGIPLAGWYVTASLPTAEAFAPVREMQQRVLLATIFLTILAAGLTWWMLRRELGPMLAAVKALTAMSQSTERQTPLPVAKQDQVGLLIEGFNHLLTTVWHGDAKLQESESRFRMMADTAPVLIWISGDDKLCHWFNQGWLDFTGRSMEQERGNGWAEGVHPEDFDRCLEFYVSHFEQRKEFRMEYRLRRHDGEYRWVDDHGVPRFGIDGMFEGYIGCCIDIHESRQANAERARLLRIIEEAPDFIATSDMQAHLKYLNNAGARLVGLPEGGDLTHLEIKDMHPAWGAKLVLEEGIAAVLEKGFWQHENALLHRDGHEVPVSQLLLVHRDASGNPQMLSTIMRDVTESKRVETDLIAARETAEAANRAKSDFLSTMSHEIRTPLNGVVGNIQLLEMSALDQEQTGYLAAIAQSSSNLVSLINDILDLSKIEAEKVFPEKLDFSLRGCIDNVALTQRSRIAPKGIFLKLEISDEVPQVLVGDDLRVKQILLNLLGNAIKFTIKGGISLSATVKEKSGDSVLIELAVRDTGIGISPAAMENLFKPFVQADNSISRNYGGTGLGLAICERLSRLMGGSISVESSEGVGSIFRVLLPFPVVDRVMAGADDPEPASQALWAGPALKVLLAEDNQISRQFGAALLKKMGHQAVVIENGKEALAVLGRQAIDIALMDIQMPVMNGDEALAVLREREQRSGRRLPVIALTAYAMKGDKERFLALGFDGYVSKPLEVKKLIAEMKRVLQVA